MISRNIVSKFWHIVFHNFFFGKGSEGVPENVGNGLACQWQVISMVELRLPSNLPTRFAAQILTGAENSSAKRNL